MIQITPKVFVENWGLVIEGYLRLPDQFIITVKTGDSTNTIAITKPDEIKAAIKSFERRALEVKGFTEPKESTQEDSLPPEIDQWLPTAKDLTCSKRINA
jgi:hypothetical protein